MDYQPPQAATPMADASAPDMADQGPKEVKTWCIEEYDDGTFKYGVEAPEAEGMPGESEMPENEATEDAGMKPAASFDEALQGLKQMQSMEGQGDMKKGFDSVQATMPNGPFQKGAM